MSNFREANIVAETPVILLDRIELAGVVSVIADITNVKTRIFQYASYQQAVDDASGTEIGTEIATLAAACMFNALQTDAMWGNRDKLGYNCRLTITAARFPSGGKYYRACNVVQPSAVGAEPVTLKPWILYALPSAID
ncbi:MAG: hypothetical protein L0211_24810 [Planctomycetaceae bacterium]|nr:hypothetical protein [Planctomycetaceae bacterium]